VLTQPKMSISLRITPDTLAKVRAIAEQDRRSTSYTIERLLIAAIAQTPPHPVPRPPHTARRKPHPPRKTR